MQSEFDIISKWCHDNGFVINAKKIKLMHIRPTHLGSSNIIKTYTKIFALQGVRDSDIELATRYKYLGITIDEHLKWHWHIDEIQKKLRCSSYALNQLRFCSSAVIMKMVYHSLVESHLRYGITAWGMSTHCSRLQKSQNRILKMFKNREVFLNINNLFIISTLNEFFSVVRYRVQVDHLHETRWKEDGRYKVPRFRNFYGMCTLECQVPRICNELPTELINNNNKKKRNNELKKYLLMQQNNG